MHGIFWAQPSRWILGESGGGGLGNWIEKINWGKAVEGIVLRILIIIICSLGGGLQWQYGRWIVVES